MLGPVFRTHDPAQDRLVAVKAFTLDLLPERVAPFVDGLRALLARAPRHPGVLPLYDAGLEHGTPYLAMAYESGETLDLVIRQRPSLPGRHAADLIARLADAIEALWRHDCGHGALHPRDIFVHGGALQVTGYGLPRLVAAAGVTPPSRRPYAAPEAGEPGADPRADVFSLGAIAHELLTGRRAVGTGEQPGEFGEGWTAEEARALRRLIATALAERPADRFASAQAFADALRAITGDAPATLPLVSEGHDDAFPAEEPAVPVAEPARDEAADVRQPAAPVVAAVTTPRGWEDDLRIAAQPAAPTLDDFELRPGGDRAAHDRTGTDARAGAGEAPRHSDRLAAFDDLDDRVVSAQPPLFGASASADDSAREPSRVLLALVVGIGGLLLGGLLVVWLVDWRPGPAATPGGGAAQTASQQTVASGAADPANGSGATDGRTSPTPPATAPDGTRPTEPAASAATPGRAAATGSAGTEAARTAADRGASTPRSSARSATPPVASRSTSANRRGPAAAPARGRVIVQSEPSGAMVLIDGRLSGETPLSVDDVPLGSHTLQIARPGYAPETRQVTLSAEAPVRNVRVELERGLDLQARAFGAIDVDSRPRGARVSIDGRFVGRSPLRLAELAPGLHVVTLERAAGGAVSRRVEVTAGQIARVQVDLE